MQICDKVDPYLSHFSFLLTLGSFFPSAALGIYGSELERQFATELPHPSLNVLFKVIQGLVRFRPQDRMSAAEALRLLESGE